jgi:hypothetical protein
MLPRLDSISAAAVLDRLSLLKYRNAHGSHIYIRPSGEHRFTTLDDLSETSLERLSADGLPRGRSPHLAEARNARQVSPNISAGRGHRAPFPALHARKGTGAQPMVRVLEGDVAQQSLSVAIYEAR